MLNSCYFHIPVGNEFLAYLQMQDSRKLSMGHQLPCVLSILCILSLQLPFPIFQPQKGYRQKLIDMCIENAKTQLDLKFSVIEKQDKKTEEAIRQLNAIARHPMNRVELFDNSHISGAFTVASCVVYEDGKPRKNDYRLFKLHTGNSDIDSTYNQRLRNSTGMVNPAFFSRKSRNCNVKR